MAEEARSKVPLRRCRWKTRAARREAVQEFIRKYGDDLPEDVIQKSTDDENLDTWATFCDKPGRIAGAMRYESQDWYLCALKNAAVRPDLRRRGIGRKVYRSAKALALKDSNCLVLSADVTWDNIPSKKILEKMGFKTINRFCWAEGAKPADILHYVHVPPRGERKRFC